jgi:hypothetical protein
MFTAVMYLNYNTDHALPYTLDYNSPHVLAVHITAHTVSNLNFRHFYAHPYFILIFNNEF